MRKITVRTSLYTATALTGALFAQPAFADCVSQAPVNPNQVVCDNPGGAGWNGGANNGIVVTVNGGASINTNVGGPAIISTGTGSAVINFGGAFNGGVGTTYGIDAGLSTNAALNVGGGTNITNDSGAAIRGSVTFGSATGILPTRDILCSLGDVANDFATDTGCARFAIRHHALGCRDNRHAEAIHDIRNIVLALVDT